MNKNNVIQVFYDGKVVGQLAMRGHSTSFEYDDDWIKTGFPISPFSLPLEKQVFTPTKPYFNGLFGAFADSLPDAQPSRYRSLTGRYSRALPAAHAVPYNFQ